MEIADRPVSTRKHKCLLCHSQFPAGEEGKSCPNDGALLVPVEEDPFIGQTFGGKYQIESLLGTGGWSRVYKAFHIPLDKYVAIKILERDLAEDPVALRRFEAEAKSTYSLVHKGIVAVHDHGAFPQPYLVMELVEGKTLEQILQECGRLELDQALALFDEICSAMEQAHQAGFIHRDLKPSNIMVSDRDSSVKILDFGLVKSIYQNNTQTGETIGSPPYMSPEQCKGQAMDARSDIYSLGCIMYEVLSGTRAFAGETAVEVMYKHFTQTPAALRDVSPDLDIPEGLQRIVGKTVEVEKADRFSSMQELREDLQRVKSGTVKARWNRYRARYRRSVSLAARVSRWGIPVTYAAFLGLRIPEYIPVVGPWLMVGITPLIIMTYWPQVQRFINRQ